MNTFHFFSEPVTNALGWALIHTFWQGTLLALLAALALQLTRQKPSWVRYGISLGALATQMVLFLITCWIEYEPVRRAMLISGDQPEWQAPATIVMNLGSTSNWSGGLTTWLQPHLPLLVTLWVLGAAVLLVRLLGGWLLVGRLKKQGIQAAPEAWQTHLNRLAEQLGITKAIRLVESTEITVPMTIGWVKPIVLIPIGLLAGLSPRQVEAVLAHELAHIRRYDYLVNLVQSAVETVLFFHPAIWWLSARVREEREHCCDDVSIRLCGERTSLAQALVHIEQRRQAHGLTPDLAMAFGARKPSFMQRVKRVIGVPTSDPKPNGWGVTGLLILLAGLVMGQSSYQPAKTGRRERDSIVINTWPLDTGVHGAMAVLAQGTQLDLVPASSDDDTLNPVERVQLEQELDQHSQELQRLDWEMERLHKPLEKLNEQLEWRVRGVEQKAVRISEEDIKKLEQKMQQLHAELERKVQKSVELERKSELRGGKLSQNEAKLLEDTKVAVIRAQQKLADLHAFAITKMQESFPAVSEGLLRTIRDSMDVFTSRIARLAEKSSFHAQEMMKLHEKLGRLDSLPEPNVYPTPVPALAPSAAPQPARVGKPAKGEYWYNGKRYDRPEDMPAAPIPPVPPAAVEQVPPVALPAAPMPPGLKDVPDAPAPPKAPRAGKKGRHIKTND